VTQPPDWDYLLQMATAEVQRIVKDLPAHLKKEAEPLPICYEPLPNEDWIEDGVAPDTMGLFVGPEFAEIETTPEPIPPQIILFLHNIWECADGDEQIFREEVRTTYLHELGHFLGLAEDDLSERGLE
jgi:predicted Zn-dependent protease with MMP-like domain